MKIFANNKPFIEFQFNNETEFEKEVVIHSKLFFGPDSIYIDTKRKIETKNLGNSIPDGFLLDLSDIESPEFYLVEVELAKHSFYSHIFPQITKFFGFYKNSKSLNDLVEYIFSIITHNADLKKEFKKILGEREIYKFIKDLIEQSQNILLVIDGEKKEVPEIMETYSDTWGKMVKLMYLKKYYYNGDFIYTMNPDFENIEFGTIVNDPPDEPGQGKNYSEESHFEGVAEILKQIYSEMKSSLSGIDSFIKFNPQKYYISIRKSKNIAFIWVTRKKIELVVMNPEDDTRRQITAHKIKTLSASVQKFWSGPSCSIVIENTENLDEVTNLLKKLLA
jgi:predicted transport protein